MTANERKIHFLEKEVERLQEEVSTLRRVKFELEGELLPYKYYEDLTWLGKLIFWLRR